MEIWTALAIGFFGSFHCIGMCGPIALALPGGNGSRFSLIVGRVLYNLGRIVTYGFLGAVFGLIAHSIALAGFQRAVSVLLGLSIIAAVIVQSNYLAGIKRILKIEAFFNWIKNSISTQFRKRGMSTLFIIGMLNGVLPCGFVYVGLAGSLTTGSVFEGMLFMVLFGAGTFPAMLAMSLAPGLISLPMRQRINQAIPFLTITFGIYLVWRGMWLGLTGH